MSFCCPVRWPSVGCLTADFKIKVKYETIKDYWIASFSLSFFSIYLVIILFFLHIVSFPLANWVRPTHKLTYPVAVDSHEISSTQRKDLLCLWNRILLSTIIKSEFFWYSSRIYQIQISIQIIFQLFQGLNIAPPDQSKGYTMKDIHIMLLLLFFESLYSLTVLNLLHYCYTSSLYRLQGKVLTWN